MIEERVNVPDGAVLERYTFPQGASITGFFTVCNAQASTYMTSEVCDDTAAIGINGNDAITLLDATGSPLVCFFEPKQPASAQPLDVPFLKKNTW